MLLFITLIILIIILYLILKTEKKFENFKNKKELFFIHIPKNAGTTIENIAFEHNILWGVKYFKKNNSQLNINIPKKNNLWHLPPKYFLDDTYKGKIIFAIVRNQYERIISECKKR